MHLIFFIDIWTTSNIQPELIGFRTAELCTDKSTQQPLTTK